MLHRAALIATPWLVVVGLWWAVAASGLINPALVPSPAQVAVRFWQLLVHGTLAFDILISTGRVFAGVALGIASAEHVGYVLICYRTVRTFV
jgi:NitT/TauT family transport system permease protein